MHLVDTTLFFSPTSGGVKRYLTAKQSWLAANTSWRHSLVVPGPERALVPGGISTLSGLKVPGTFNYRLPLSMPAWTAMLDALEPDLIEAGDAFHPAWCALKVADRRRIPAVAFFHSNLPRLIGRRLGSVSERVVGRYLRLAYERMNLVQAPSRLMCDYLRSLGIERVSHQPLGVDSETFAPHRRREDLRQRLGLAPGVRLLAYAGRFAGEKNLPVLHDAFARLGDGYHLLLLGGGRSYRAASNVTVMPYRRNPVELAEALASVDALVHAGTAETFGLVILEAMACGRPVVGIDSGAVPELVDDEVGTLASRADGELFARAVRDLYDRDVEQLGRAARTRVLTRFTWQQAMQVQMAAYAGLAGTEPAVVARPANAGIVATAID
ncbi:MAG: glycosyltransferase [Steroidobacteraceae bacterium]